jgi:hypothetical protein
MSRAELFDALVKLATAKRLRTIDDSSAVRRAPGIAGQQLGHHFDWMASFLICERLSFDLENITSQISANYSSNGIEPRHRHNLLLSLENGVLCYKNDQLTRNVAWMYPFAVNQQMKNRLVTPGENGRNHLGIFTAYLFSICANATIYLPQIKDYDYPPTMGTYQDER